MAVGQAVLSGAEELDGLQAAGRVLEAAGVDDGRVQHARVLRAVLALDVQYCAAGMPLSALPQAALLLRCSEFRAGKLISEAHALSALPEAFEALEWGLLTPEQSAVVVTQLGKLPVQARLAMWQRLLTQLRADAAQGVVRPPARLGELLAGWVLEAAPQDAVQRRERAEQGRQVDYRKREDGLVDVFLIGLRAPDAQAVLQRIREQSEPMGMFDLRTVEQRRLDAAVALLLGRTSSTGCKCAGAGASGGIPDAAACGCLPGQAAPCGSDIGVLVHLNTGLEVGDEPAELAGHGPIEPDLLQALLLNAPRLRPVFIDDDGVPIALGDQVIVPERGDPASVRAALLQIAQMRPDRTWPRHPHDHPPEPGGDPGGEGDDGGGSGGGGGHPPDPPEQPRETTSSPAPTDMPGSAVPALPDELVLAEAALGGSHPEGQPGSYRPSRALRRLIKARSPRCEFPGCGARATRCDDEHDKAWPQGPTCSCNLGPCCRRHHRVKQEGWTKTRGLRSQMRWTDPTGRSWLSPSQHQPPTPAVRALPLLQQTPNPFDELSPLQQEHELWLLAGRPDDPAAYELRAHDVDPDDEEHDSLEERLTTRSTRWTLDLLDPYAWLDEVPQADDAAA